MSNKKRIINEQTPEKAGRGGVEDIEQIEASQVSAKLTWVSGFQTTDRRVLWALSVKENTVVFVSINTRLLELILTEIFVKPGLRGSYTLVKQPF